MEIEDRTAWPFAGHRTREPSGVPVQTETEEEASPTVDAPLSVVLRRSAVGAAAVLVLMVASGLAVGLATSTAIGEADLEVTRWFADHRTTAIDAVATVGSSLADTFTVLGVLLGAATMLAAAGRSRHAWFLVVAVSTEFAVFLATSTLIDRDRPDVEPLGDVPSTASYPSGHVAVAIVLYGGLCVVASSISRRSDIGRVGAGMTVVVASLVGMSRLYEGVHHPIDVLGGGLLGVTALLSTTWAFQLTPTVATRPPALHPGSDLSCSAGTAAPKMER